MEFHETRVKGAYVIEIDRVTDQRGFFARVWDEDEFARAGLQSQWVQGNVGYSRSAGTLRGLHYQRDPFSEAKLVRCTRGSIFDVAADLRSESPTYLQWAGAELSAENRSMLYVPEGCAHGYLTLEPQSEIFYLTSQSYHQEVATGVRFDDVAFGIEWPAPISVVSQKDRNWSRWATGEDRP